MNLILKGFNSSENISRSADDFSILLPDVDRLAALFTLSRISGMGPAKFREMHEIGIDPQLAIHYPDILPFTGRNGEKLRAAVAELTTLDIENGNSRATREIKYAKATESSIIIHGDPYYPDSVYQSNYPIPILYVRGNPAIWSKATSIVAVVGSRNTREPYTTATREFSLTAALSGLAIVSGFATGADTMGHRAAFDAQGRTVAVMPCGVDQVFPPENLDLWKQLLHYPLAVFVSEVGFGQRATSLSLRRRNKLIASFSQAVLVAQSASDGGAMNAYRCAKEQRKHVATFKPDGTTDTTGNERIASDPRSNTHVFNLSDNAEDFRSWMNEF